MTVVHGCVLVTLIQATLLLTTDGVRVGQSASELKSRNITHNSVVLEWLPPVDVQFFSNYKLTLFDDNSRVVRDRIIDNSSQTYTQFRSLEVWTNYTARLVTYDVQNEVLGKQWHSFSTRFFILNAETLLAIAALFFISVCYILALLFKFTCNFDEDYGKWREQLIEEYQKQRIEKKAKMQKYKRKKNSIKRQFSSLLIWRKHETSTISDDSVKDNTSLDNIPGILVTIGTNRVLDGSVEDDQPKTAEIEVNITVNNLQTCGVDDIDKVSVGSEEYVNTTQYSNTEESNATDEQNITDNKEQKENADELLVS